MSKNKIRSKENLTQRAYLNSVTRILDYISKVITGFVVTPFLINGLGDILFGVWQILGQLSGYTDVVDIRPAQVLKWAIAKDKNSISDDELKKYVTATFLLTLLILPLFMLIGLVLVWYSPQITGVSSEYFELVRISTAIIILSVLISKLFSIFESILRGMNLGYKRMGFRASIFIIIGFLKVLAIKMGYGLIELALVQVFNSVIITVVLYVIVKKYVPWFGLTKINYEQTKSFFKISGWYAFDLCVKMVNVSSDKILLGYLAGPVFVSKYVITKYISHSVLSGLVYNLVHGAMPGVGKLFGEKEYQKLSKIRNTITSATVLLCVVIGSVILLFNHSFISLWANESLFVGQIENLIILLMIIQYIFIENDSNLILVTLDVKTKTLISLFSVIISILVASVLIKIYHFGILGLCVGIITGRLFQSITYPYIIQKKLQINRKNSFSKFRPFLVSSVILFLGYYFGQNLFLDNWIHLILSVILISPLVLIITFFIGFDIEEKNEMKKYLRKIKYFKND